MFVRDAPVANSLDSIVVTGSRIAAVPSITNNQEANVDEGDIVKRAGRFLIVLSSGVLYVVDTGTPNAPTLALVERLEIPIDADSREVWYDELLVTESLMQPAPGHMLLVGSGGCDDRVICALPWQATWRSRACCPSL